MNAFFSGAALMLLLALCFLLPPLLVRHGAAGEAGEAGEAGDALVRSPRAAPRQRLTAALIALLVGALAVTLYLYLGAPKGLQPSPEVVIAQADASGGVGAEQVEKMVGRLAEKLKAQPNDPDGWRMLARSYETLRRFESAADAYRHLLALDPDNPDLLVDYAVVLGMTLNQRLSGAPQVQIARALAIDPHHLQALALSGSAALERGDYANAVKPWKQILALVPADSEIGRSIAASIAKAEARQR